MTDRGRTLARLGVLAGGGAWLVVCLVTLLFPVHGHHEAGMPAVSVWPVERWLSGTDGRFLSYRQSLVGGNLLVAYWLALLAPPAASLAIQLRWRRRGAHSLAGLGLTVAAAGGLAWLGAYHLFALMVAIPGWGVLVTACLLVVQGLVGLGWLLGSLGRR